MKKKHTPELAENPMATNMNSKDLNSNENDMKPMSSAEYMLICNYIQDEHTIGGKHRNESGLYITYIDSHYDTRIGGVWAVELRGMTINKRFTTNDKSVHITLWDYIMDYLKTTAE